jgi:hypothetical protein
MPRSWKEIPVDLVLDDETANTAEMARYERIMQHRSTQATIGLTDTIRRAAEVAEEKSKILVSKLDIAISKADDAINRADAAATAEGRRQTAMTALTLTLVACTLTYTAINGWSAWEMHQGNKIQAQVAATAKDQVSAARDANEIQRKALSVRSPGQ